MSAMTHRVPSHQPVASMPTARSTGSLRVLQVLALVVAAALVVLALTLGA